MSDDTARVGDRLAALGALAVEQAARVAKLEEEVAAAKQALTRTMRTDLPELMTELGMSEVALDHLGIKIAVAGGVDISIPETKRADAFAWMVEHGFGALVRTEVKVTFGATELERAQACDALLADDGYQPEVNMTVPPPTLKAWARERLAAGEDIPPELFNVRAYDMARISTIKRKRVK